MVETASGPHPGLPLARPRQKGSGLTTRMLALLLALFFISTPLNAEPTDDQVWMIVRPRQCMSNPWEKAWMKKNKNQAAQYPRADEFDVIKQFFAAKNVPILEMRFKPYVKGDPYCQTCE